MAERLLSWKSAFSVTVKIHTNLTKIKPPENTTCIRSAQRRPVIELSKYFPCTNFASYLGDRSSKCFYRRESGHMLVQTKGRGLGQGWGKAKGNTATWLRGHRAGSFRCLISLQIAENSLSSQQIFHREN